MSKYTYIMWQIIIIHFDNKLHINITTNYAYKCDNVLRVKALLLGVKHLTLRVKRLTLWVNQLV